MALPSWWIITYAPHLFVCGCYPPQRKRVDPNNMISDIEGFAKKISFTISITMDLSDPTSLVLLASGSPSAP